MSDGEKTQAGTFAKVAELPSCNFCNKSAKYDFKTRFGGWAYGCETHWFNKRHYETLGTGKGQKLILDK